MDDDNCQIRGHSTPPRPQETLSEAPSTSRLSMMPHPEKDIAPAIKKYKQIHDKYESLAPRAQLPPHRYLIAVIAEGKSAMKANAAKDIIWFKGNRFTTGETVRRMYGIVAASDDVNLLLGGIRVNDLDRMEELDLCKSKIIILNSVRTLDLAINARKLSDGLEEHTDVMIIQ